MTCTDKFHHAVQLFENILTKSELIELGFELLKNAHKYSELIYCMSRKCLKICVTRQNTHLKFKDLHRA